MIVASTPRTLHGHMDTMSTSYNGTIKVTTQYLEEIMRNRDLSTQRSVECGACQASGLVSNKTCRICGGEGYIKKTRMASREVKPLSHEQIQKIDTAKKL